MSDRQGAGAVTVEAAREEDDAAVAALARVCFGDATGPDDVGALRAGPHTEVFVSRRGEAPVGFAVLQVVADEAELHRVAVHPDHRRRGLARRLVEAVLRRAEARGAARLYLEVARGNAPAVALYRGMGFDVDGVRRAYYSDGDDALLMSRPASAAS